MNTFLQTHRMVFYCVVCLCQSLCAFAQSKSNSKGPDSPVVVGTLTAVDDSGRRFEILQTGKHRRRLYADARTKIDYVGFPDKARHQPTPGYGVKASSEKDGRLKSLLFTPAVAGQQPLGPEKLTMTVAELFTRTDRDRDDRVGYVEFSQSIHASPKHGPEMFRKVDSNADGELTLKEFSHALDGVAWWTLSRRTPAAWIAHADRDRDGHLNLKEFAAICTSGNHVENIFRRCDLDKSGDLSRQETTAYIRGVTHGKEQRKRKAAS